MLTFRHEKGRFNYRAVGVALHHGRVLIHKAEVDDFWTLPGGRVEFGESAADALVREFDEEIAVSISIERLLWVAENFFEYAGLNYHELAFYFLANIPENSEILEIDEFIGYEEAVKLTFRWHPVNELNDLILYPDFLPSGLADIPESTQYIIHRDIKI